MKFKLLLGTWLTTLLILGSHAASLVMAQTPDDPGLKLLFSDDQAIVLELTVTDFEVETIAHEGRTYQRIIIPTMFQTHVPGEPQVPLRGTMVGLPSLSGLSVEIIDSDYETLAGSYRLYPTPRLSVIGDDVAEADAEGIFALDQALYATDALYPGQPVKVGEPGMMRDQPVASVQFYPVQYNPVSGEVRLYRRILARITWDTSLLATETRLASPDYEQVLRNTLLNYATLRRPPLASGAPSPGQTGDEEIGVTDTTPRLKIGVTQDGIYKLTPSDLTGNGFSLSGVYLSKIKIKNRGAQIPLYVYDENSDNEFNGSDYILFYGVAITDIYTIKNIYWLEAGDNDGLRMNVRNGAPGSATLAQHFPTTLYLEKNTYYFPTLPHNVGYDYWFWGNKLTTPGYRDYSFNLSDISTTAANATVRVRLKGYTDVSTNPDHHTRIYLNSFGAAIDDQWWDGQIVFDHEKTVSHSFLKNGGNTLRIEGVDDTGASVDQFFVDWIEIDYWDKYVAEDDELLFGAPSAGIAYKFAVTNFSSNQVQLFDVTDPTDVEVIIGTVVTGGVLEFEDTAQADTRYLALTSDAYESPASIVLDQPSNWKDSSNGADYIIITHGDFYPKTQPLADNRGAIAGGGFLTKTVTVEDIYDEFNDGIFNPQAIQDFLKYTLEEWNPAPTYVLLVGGASEDYRDLLGYSKKNYVPTQMVETYWGQAASDNWFVLLSDPPDIYPDMFIGRLTSQTVSQAEEMVTKILYYEQNPPPSSWNTNVLLVADDGNPPDNDDTFEITSDELAARLPYHYTANKVYLLAGQPDPPNPKASIINYINNGSLLVNYSGHGSVIQWAQENIFCTSDIPSLNNINKLPVVTIADCLNGDFVGNQTSIAEEFLRRSNKGAVAVWAATSLGYATGHRVLLTSFYDLIFQQNKYGLGQATTEAEIAVLAYGWDDLVKTFVLFGDPAMQLGGGTPQGPGSGSVFLPLVIKSESVR
jgi:hypothetical protein